MKKAILTLAVLCGVFFSCSKPTEEISATIYGQWKCTSYTKHIHDYGIDTILCMNDEAGKTWKFSETGWFYIDGERQGNYEHEQVNANPNGTMDIIHLYYELSEPSYHIERKSYAIVKLTQSEMMWRITSIITDELYYGFLCDIQIQFNSINNNQ